jgi:RNAse (barnase) inhibitor barstar
MDIRLEALTSATLEAGPYRIDRLPFRPEESGVLGPPFRYFLPDLEHVQRETLLHALADALEFPGYYGVNWDAAFDCLTDRDWAAGAVVTIQMKIAPEAVVDEAALTALIDLIGDACSFWSDREVTLYFLILSPREDLASLSGLPTLRLV